MIRQPPQISFLEFRIPDDNTRRINKCHAPHQRVARSIRERIRIYTGLPLRGDKSSFSLETRFGFGSDAAMESAVDDGKDRADEDNDDEEGIEKNPLRESHALESASSLKR